MKVLLTTLREKSHFAAMEPYLQAFQRAGHEVAVAAPPDFAGRVAETGARFFAFGHPGDEGLRPIWTKIRASMKPGGSTAGNSGAQEEKIARITVEEIFAGVCAEAALPALLETIARFRPAIVVRETCEFAGLLAAEKLGIPHARIAITARGAESELRKQAAASVDVHRRNIGLTPDPTGERIRDEPSMTLFPASFDGEAAAASMLRFRALRKPAGALPDWWGGLPGPFVYVTLGTVAGQFEMIHAAYRATVEAVRALPVRALLTIGAALSLDVLGELPPNVHVERFVPQDEVLPHAAAVVCHGGSGTVTGALAAGVPMVVTPMFADQPHNAERVAAIGAGLALPKGAATAEELRAALSRVLAENSFLEAARATRREIEALPPIDQAASEIQRLALG